MPKPSDYTPARRRTMQAVMWVTLLATVALAEVVSQSARRANRVELAPQSITVQDVSVRLPANKWRPRPRGDDPRVIVQAAEAAGPEDERAGRTIRIWCERLATPMSPLEYLGVAFDLAPPDDPAPDTEYSLVSTAKVAGRSGVLVLVRGASLPQGEPVRDWYACAVLPSLRAVVVHLHGVGEPVPGDRAVVGTIAGSITLAGEPATKAAGVVTLPQQQINFAPPKGYVAVDPPTDDMTTDRRLWRAEGAAAGAVASGKGRGGPGEFERDWTTIDVVGCLAPAGKGIEQKQREKITSAMLTMLLARDPQRWRGATVSPEGDTTWRAEPARSPTPGVGRLSSSSSSSSSSSDFPTRAYLVTDTKGLGLLAIFHGGYHGGGFDPEWQALRDSVKLPDTSPLDLAAMKQAGADEAKRLRDVGYEKLLADRVEQWWLWTGGGEHPHLGWSHVEFDIHGLAGKTEMRQRRPSGLVSRLTGTFAYKDSDGGYQAEFNRLDADHEETRTSIRQTTSVSGDQLSLGVQVGDAPAALSKLPLPPNYIPGALLPLVMGKISADRSIPGSRMAEPPPPIIVRTESFPGGCEVVGPAELLSVLIRPVPPEAATRKADGEPTPMRCLTAEVNGSGRVSRWFFRKSGELECVEFPGGVRCVLSDQAAIGFDFGNEKRMTP